MTCTVVHSECVKVGTRVPITLDLSMVIARKWRAGAIYALNERIRGTKHGFEFDAGSAGQSGDREPKWPKVLEGTVQDGSILWTAKAVSVDSLLKVLASATWTVPTGVTSSGTSISATEQTATAYLEVTAAGTYEVVCWATFNDTPAHVEGFAVSIEAE